MLGRSGSLINTWKWPPAQQELFTGAAINSSALRGDLQTPQLPFLAAEPSIWGKPPRAQRVQGMPVSAAGLVEPKHKGLDPKGSFSASRETQAKLFQSMPE